MNELLAFVRELRAAGLTVSTDRLSAAAEALATLPADPYWSLRATLCSRWSDLEVFDAVWRARSSVELVPESGAGELAGADLGAQPDGAEPESGEGQAGAGDLAELTRRDVRTLTAAELTEIQRLIALLKPMTRRRPAMRRTPARTGRLDPRRTARLWLRTGGEPSRILRTRRAWRPRRLLMLLDVSGSMAEYSDVMLRFAHAAVAAGPASTEVFAIGTGCTRLTTELLAHDSNAAMIAIGEIESHWDGGTTLGPSLRDFLRTWGGRTAVRSSIVVISSDGLEFGDLTELPRQVARLSRLGHALIWVNPAQGLPGYVPLSPALTESLPYATEQVSGHTFDSLRQLAEVIAR